MSWDVRYFYIDSAAAGLVFDGGAMTIAAGDYAITGEVGGADFGNVGPPGSTSYVLESGVSTLTGPDGEPALIVAAAPFFWSSFSAEGTPLPNPDLTSALLLEDGTLAILQVFGGEDYAGVLPDVMTVASSGNLSSGSSYNFSESNYDGSFGGAAGMTCFVAGTMIAALHGPVPVEALRPGDLVLTRDRGYRPVRWAGARHISPARLAAADRLRPVTLAPGALGPGMPARPLTVSPQHRMLLAGPEIAARFGTAEVLAAAKHLIGLPGIAPAAPDRGVTYHHLLFDAHEVVLAEGAWSESLFTGPMAMKMMPAAQRAEIFTLFPRLAGPGAPAHAAPARRFLNGREARALLAAMRAAQPGLALAALPFVPIAPMSEEAAACAGAPDA